jgi:glyoxylase-like metal-dependent hydrolase (beta-lactamase superfamily II)
MQSHPPGQPIRLELPFAIDRTTVNAYLFLEPEPVLIDTGDSSEEVWQALLAGLADHGVTPADLSKVFITHIHIDHFGQAARLARESEASFFVIEAGYEWLTNFRANWQVRRDYYKTTFLPAMGLSQTEQDQMVAYSQWVLENYEGVPAPRVRPLRAGDAVTLGAASWQVLHLPGHASTQTCFYQPESRRLLSSDMLLARTPTPVVEPSRAEEKGPRALPLFVQSLDRMRGLAIDCVYPGHGGPFDDADSVIERQLARIARRKEECFGHVAAGVQTVAALVEKMYSSSRYVNMSAVWMVVGYLDLLENEGRLAMEAVDGVWRYRVR